MHQLELLVHFSFAIYVPELEEDHDATKLVLDAALGAEYLMLEVLALSARHLSTTSPDKAGWYLDLSFELQTKAIQLFNNNATQGESLQKLLFSSILGRHILVDTLVSRDLEFGQFLDRFIQGIRVHRGTRAVLDVPEWDSLINSKIGSLIEKGIDPLGFHNPTSLRPPFETLISESFRLDADGKLACDKALRMIQGALDDLESSERRTFGLRMIFVWPILLPEGFIRLLEHRVPEAIAILGRYAILLKAGRMLWQIKDAGQYLFNLVLVFLGRGWEIWVRIRAALFSDIYDEALYVQREHTGDLDAIVPPRGFEDWRHESDDEIANQVLDHPDSLDFQGRSLYFRVLRAWLLNCDDNHDECRLRQSGRWFWPTRPISVGDYPNLRLAEEPNHDRDYVVLSHCWGKPTEEERNRFCTTPQNYHPRLDGFHFDDLPKTFQDAIEVTRALGKKYLWIDALCIIQGPKDDWESEAGRMEHVFTNAYCTIAASSAGGWKDGFLQSGLWDQIDPESMECHCSFDSEVREAPLLKRAWVLQERVLSRRIIHFTAEASRGSQGHTCWECGDGIRCQQFSKLVQPICDNVFALDPHFPARLKEAEYYRSLEFIQKLFKEYSQAGLTYKSDRDTAILSLLNRISYELNTEVRYGTIRCFLGSLLLWKRTAKELTPPIDFGSRAVPLWSWMAYDGSIDFIINYHYEMGIPRDADLGFTPDGKRLNVRIWQFENCQLGENEGCNEYAVYAGNKKIGSLWFDMEDHIEFKHCVVVGAGNRGPEKTLYVLVVQEEPGRERYKRLGAGTLTDGSLLVDGYVSMRSEPGRLV
ncbi:HET domain-containing protein [Fusarium sp. LHS14.1]|nr:HET domain-containing protein [Fusarium sp. LHS14.1]